MKLVSTIRGRFLMGFKALGAGSALVLSLLFWPASSLAQPKESIGQHQQPLRTDAPVIAVADQEQLGLVAVRRTGFMPHCSGVLLRNNWVVTAAHCVDRPSDRTQPATVQVVAGWRPDDAAPLTATQAQAVAALYTFWTYRTRGERPETTYDVALIRLADPIRVLGKAVGYQREIERAGLWDLLDIDVRVYGRGLNEWAFFDASNNAVAAAGDGQYRGQTFRIGAVTRNGTQVQPGGFGNLLQFPSSAATSVLGGDSGGPTFRNAPNASARLLGVHAQCGGTTSLLEGRCPDTDGSQWRWVSGLQWCADAPLSLVRNAIDDLVRQTWDPTALSQQIQVMHSEGDVERDLRLGQLDGLRWSYVARAVQKMCVNRGLAAGVATGQHRPNENYTVVCFGAAAGTRVDLGANAGGPWSFQDTNGVEWAQAHRSAADMCRRVDPASPGGFHTGFSIPGSGLFQTSHGVFCLNPGTAGWRDTPANTLGAAARLAGGAWAASYRAASDACRGAGFARGGFLNGHEAPGVRGTVCLR